MRRTLLLFLLAALPAGAQQIDDPANLMGERVASPALADTLPIDHGVPALEQLLRKLRTRASMMLIVAHPDDEDSGLLTYESRGQGARVAMLTLTRGEGGQNLMSADFNDALGLIRTEELLAEDRYTGVDQFFGTEIDFGFSKTKEETFKQWGHERVLYDAVRAVRLYRPLVLASVFVGGVTDGHGQHQVSGEITQEVFAAAADPKVFPEMGLPVWAPVKVYAREPFAPVTEKGMFDYATGRYSPTKFHNYVTGVETDREPKRTVTIEEGEKPGIAAFHGLSYVQWARQGLALQKSQIGEGVRVPPAGAYEVGYTRMASRLEAKPETETSLFEGIDTTLAGIASLAPDAPAVMRLRLRALDEKAAEAQKSYDPAKPERVAGALREALGMLDGLIGMVESSQLARGEKFNVLHELRVKRVQGEEALALALGLDVKPVVEGAAGRVGLEPEEHFSVAAHMTEHGGVTVGEVALKPGAGLYAEAPVRTSAILAATAPSTRPYYARTDPAQAFYDVANAALRNAPVTPAPIALGVRAAYQGTPFRVESAVAVQPDAQQVTQAAVVVPPISVSVSSAVGILRPNEKSFVLGVKVERSSRGGGARAGRLHLQLPQGWVATPETASFELPEDGSSVSARFNVVPGKLTAGVASTVVAVADFEGRQYREGFRPVGYAGLTYTNLYTPASFRAVPVDVQTAPGLRVAYVAGTGDAVAGFLPSLGVTPTILKVAELTAATLAKFDVVVLGVRAYAAHPELGGAGSGSLNEFARAGGVVIAQYNSGGFNPASAPYPFTLPGDSAHNVVDEDQPVEVLVPHAPVLTWPNRITPDDFKGWIEERGHGFASEWAPEYQALLETHDIDQDPQKGGLLLAQVGKGAYIYCALALYRQLPEGVPGAYRLMANLLSYVKNPERASK